MKTNFLAKHKWLALTIVLMIALIAVSVSYSAWDTLSVNKILANAGSGDFKEKPDTIYQLGTQSGDDIAPMGEVNVGDRVTCGVFYQDKDAAVENSLTYGKTEPLRWIVVNKDATQLTLLTEKVVVYGNYWGNGAYRNDYYRSTVRSWLNSGKSSVGNTGANDNVRNDGLPIFGVGSNGKQVNKGFLDVVFTPEEQSMLKPKSISDMRYVASGWDGNNKVLGNCTTTTGKPSITDLVWLPSYEEIYGTGTTPWGAHLDGPNVGTKFTYFNDNNGRVAGATDYAWNAGSSSYYNNGSGSPNGTKTPTDSNNDGIMEGTWWWLRSPGPSSYRDSLYVHTGGSGGNASPHDSSGGVRPAVCVQL